MKRHLAYLKYVLRHKYFVFVAGRKLGVPIPRLLLHDLSKFLPSEWRAYAECFYDDDGSNCYRESQAFNKAWLLHQHRNPHHHQYWVLKQDHGPDRYLEMPDVVLAEMVADWAGAGKAIGGHWDLWSWFNKRGDGLRNRMHPQTYAKAEALVREFNDNIMSGG